jgi:hypothetical protein
MTIVSVTSISRDAGARPLAALLRAARDRAAPLGRVLVLGAIASLAEGQALDLTGS